jgi:predicted  nucleic acid-binding Zn-ribbon protein
MLYRLWVKVLSFFRLVPAREKEELLREVFKLERDADALVKEIERLTDENKSVWDLIDELQESSKITPATVDSFVEDVRESVLDDMLKNFKPAGEA